MLSTRLLFVLSAALGSGALSPRNPNDCVVKTTTINGRSCTTECGIDRPGGDYEARAVTNFQKCVKACANDKKCTDAQYDLQNGWCYLKNSSKAPVKKAWVNGVVCKHASTKSTTTTLKAPSSSSTVKITTTPQTSVTIKTPTTTAIGSTIPSTTTTSTTTTSPTTTTTTTTTATTTTTTSTTTATTSTTIISNTTPTTIMTTMTTTTPTTTSTTTTAGPSSTVVQSVASSSTTSVTTLPTATGTDRHSSFTTPPFNTATYSPYSVELPTFTSTFAAVLIPNTTTSVYSITQTPTPSCFIDTSSLDQKFTLFAPGGLAFIPKNGLIGTLEESDFPGTSEDANEAFANNLGPYSFEVPSAGPAGFYDLTTTSNGSKVYVALQPSTMAVHAISSSTDGQTPNSDGFVTTIFSFTCDGRVTINYSGTTYTWSIGPDGVNTVMSAGTPSNGTEVLLLPTTTPPGVVPNPNDGTANSTTTLGSRSERNGRYARMPTLQARDSPYTDGQLPRVPYSPPHLVSRPRPGVRPMQFNGCGSDSTVSYIPQFNFGSCCDNHDYCYDNCQGGQVELCHNQFCAPGSWEGCNSAFYDCMHNTACPDYSWFWHPIKRAACEVEASFYAWVVTTHFGADAFKDANSERCGVYCPNLQPMCEGSCNINFQGNDNNNCGGCGWTCATGYHYACESGQCVCTADTQNDNNNCGNCGWQCPYKTHCSGGSCKCDDDQCGNLCVDLKSHPRNCGSCGHVCSTGYCDEGQCIDPSTIATPPGSAPQCLPTDAIKNGGFDTIQSSSSASPWFTSSRYDTYDSQLTFVADNAATSPPNVALVNGVNGYYNGELLLLQNITMCPGTTYEMTLSIGSGSQYGGECDVQIMLMGKQVGIGFPNFGTTTMKGIGPFQITVPSAPAGGGTGWGPSDDFTTVEFDSTGTFAYGQVAILVDALEGECEGGMTLDDVSIYQAS